MLGAVATWVVEHYLQEDEQGKAAQEGRKVERSVTVGPLNSLCSLAAATFQAMMVIPALVLRTDRWMENDIVCCSELLLKRKVG